MLPTLRSFKSVPLNPQKLNSVDPLHQSKIDHYIYQLSPEEDLSRAPPPCEQLHDVQCKVQRSPCQEAKLCCSDHLCQEEVLCQAKKDPMAHLQEHQIKEEKFDKNS